MPILEIPYPCDSYKKRFEAKITKRGPDECWEWRGSKTIEGYGRFGIGTTLYLSNRIAWVIENGPIPDGMLVLHSCDNPRCCNTNHFFLGTHLTNTRDKLAKGRGNHAKGDRQARRLHPELFPIGEDHYCCRFKESDVREIRRLADEGFILRDIAKDRGVSYNAIRKIVLRISWKHVA